jgi:hypothetical protein
MPVPTLSQLVTPVTATDALAQLLAIEQALGVPVTAWQKLGIGRTIYATLAQEFADNSATINFLAQGGYASYAAQMVDGAGAPVTTWLDLVASEVYGISRIGSTFASCDSTGFTLSNTGATTHGPFDPGQLHFANSTTGAQYTNTATVSIPPGTTGCAIVAEVAGSGSTSAPTEIDTMVTPYDGVGCSNSATLTGSDAETNPSLYLRCIAKLGSLSPNGARLAYYFVATSILDPTQPLYNASLSKPITRCQPITNPGTVDTYIANDAGAPSTGDTTIVDAAIQAWCVPLAVTAVTHKATNLSIPVTYHAYVPAAAGVTSGDVTTAVSAALVQLFKDLPIGGIVETSSNEVPLETIRGTIFAAIAKLAPGYSARVSVTVSAPSGDTAVATTEVPVLGAVTPTVTLT